MCLQFRISFLYFLVFTPIQGINPHDTGFWFFFSFFFSLLFQITFVDIEVAALNFCSKYFKNSYSHFLFLFKDHIHLFI